MRGGTTVGLEGYVVHHGQTSADEQGLCVRSSPQRWAYAASVPLASSRTDDASERIELTITVSQGAVGILLVDSQDKVLAPEQVRPQFAGTQRVVIDVPEGSGRASLVLRNASVDGRVEFVLHEIRTLPPRADGQTMDVAAASLFDGAELRSMDPLQVVTSPREWGYAVGLPIPRASRKLSGVRR